MASMHKAPHKTGDGAFKRIAPMLVFALLLLVIWCPLSAPVVRGYVIYPPNDTIPKFRMALGNHGSPLWLFPRDNGTLWIMNTSSPITSSPVVGAGRVYVGTMGGSVLCLSATSGSVLWEHRTGGPIESTPAIDGGYVYVGSDDKGLHCLDAETGRPVWNATTGGEIKSSPAVWEGLVMVGSNDFGLHAFAANTGAPLWNFSTGGWVYSSPAIWQGRAYFGSCDGRLYCVNATTGVEQWHFNASYMPASPAVMDGIVVVGAYDERLYAIDAIDGNEIWNVSIGDGSIYSSAAVGRPLYRSFIEAFVGDNGGQLSMVFNGEVHRTWALGGAVKSSPVYLHNITDEVPRPPPLDAVIVGTEAGEVVAVNPAFNETDAFYGPESWWRLKVGTSVSASPFIYHERVYISATKGDGGVVACIGDLRQGEGTVTIDAPTAGSHLLGEFNVSFRGSSDSRYGAVVLAGGKTFNATWQVDHWVANIRLGSTVGAVTAVAKVVLGNGDVFGEGSVEVFVRNPKGPMPRVVIDKPEEDSQVGLVVVASGRVEGEYPPVRLEASWDDSGCWTAFEPVVNWTLAMSTAGLDKGIHTLHVRAFDGMFTGEDSVKVAVGEVQEGTGVGLLSVIAIALLLAFVVALVLTRPKPPPRT